MTIYVWAIDTNNALENTYFCKEYKTEEEARKKGPRVNQEGKKLFVVEVKELLK